MRVRPRTHAPGPSSLSYLPAVDTIMLFVWDETKRRTNLRKHGIDFAYAERILAGITLTAEDNREAYGERRFLSLGLLDDQVVSIAHTEHDEEICIISIRKATKREAHFYFSQIIN